jgi:hypothetical protein
MSNEADNRGVLTVGFALLALVTGGLLLVKAPLQSDRPEERSAVVATGPEAEPVMVRLWQDPVAAVEAHWAQLSNDYSDRQRLPPRTLLPVSLSAARDRFERDASPQLRIMIITPGGPYADDAEQRRRQRYALVTSLTDNQYVPVSEDRIGYLIAPPFRRPSVTSEKRLAGVCKQGACGGDSPVLVAYERYGPAANLRDGSAFRWKSIVVFWLSSTDFGGAPLDHLAALSLSLAPSDKEREIATVVVGPASSSGLHAWFQARDSQEGRDSANAFLKRTESFPDAATLLRTGPPAMPASRFDPDPETSMRQLEDEHLRRVAQQINRIDSYLDIGLPIAAKAGLRSCLESGSSQLRACLSLDVVRDIRDSDSKWIETMLKELEPDTPTARIATINDYLDRNLSQSATTTLTACFEANSDVWNCLSQVQDVTDSDSNWRRTLTARLDPGSAAGFVEHINDYLDSGLSQAGQDELFECIRGGGQLRRCLESDSFKSITDGDEAWRDTVSRTLAPNQVETRVQQVKSFLGDDVSDAQIAGLRRCMEASTPLWDCLGGIQLTDRPGAEWRWNIAAKLEPDSPVGRVGVVSDYLDDPLDDRQKNELRACLEQDNASLGQCLTQGSISEIVDSDPDWRNTVASPPSSHEQVAQTIRAVAGDNLWQLSLLLAVFNEVDDPQSFPKITDPARLGSCLNQAPQTQEDQAQLLTNCLESVANGAEWPETVASSWLAGNLIPSHSEADLRSAKAELRVISTRATAPLPLLLRVRNTYSDGDLAADLGVRRFETLLSTDIEVLTTVAQELEARGGCRPGRIAILTEQDSYYGRVFLDVMESVKDKICPQWKIVDYGYLRGVDGEEAPIAGSPGIVGSESRDEANPNTPGLVFSSGYRERVIGSEQLDYIRRLADKIGDEADHDSADGETTELVAVGVLGNDVYDKQLILRALRERLPAETYFTTDLDARLADPDQYGWTRNLIVGSSYGLLSSATGSAPFRDNYQTAFHRAIQLAVNDEQVVGAPLPRLFEIGRSEPIDITPCGDSVRGVTPACDDEVHGRVGWTQHKGSQVARTVEVLVLLAPLLVFAVVSFVFSVRSPRSPMHRYRAHKINQWLAVATMVIIASVLSLSGDETAEPWLLLEGVSVIPTLVLYAVAVILAIGVLVITSATLSQNMQDINESQGLNPQPGKWRLRPFSETVARTSVSRWVQELAALKDNNRSMSIDDVWLRYCRLADWRSRTSRVVLPACVWSVVIVLLAYFQPGPLLAREVTVGFTRALAIATGIGVAFWCMDALRLGQILTRALVRHEVTGWRPLTTDPKDVDAYVTGRWRSMTLVATQTEVLGVLTLLPFMLFFVLVLARSSVFDGWVWTPTVLAIYGGFAAYVLFRALGFQFEAAKGRDQIVRDLHRYMLRVDRLSRARIQIIVDQIKELRSGAFVPWTRHPILQSIAIPSGGLGLLTLLAEFFA